VRPNFIFTIIVIVTISFFCCCFFSSSSSSSLKCLSFSSNTPFLFRCLFGHMTPLFLARSPPSRKRAEQAALRGRQVAAQASITGGRPLFA